MGELKSGCPFCGTGPHEGPTKVQHDQLHGEPFQNYQFWCPHGHASVTAADRERALEIWNTRTPPPGYALVKLEGAEERVARAIYAKTPFYRLKNSDDRKHGETPFEQLPYEEAPLSEELNDIAQAAIRALTEGE